MSKALLEEYIETGNASGLSALLLSDPQLANHKTSQQVSPLMLSCYYKRPDLSDILLKHVAEINIFEASALGRSDLIAEALKLNSELINEFSEDGFTPLSLAAFFGKEDATRYLLLNGADPNIPSQNVFHVYPIHSAIAANCTMIAKMLMEAGADINVVQQSGGTPLHSAAHHGNIELLIILLEAGADVNAKMEDGKTAADKASEKGFAEIARILS